MNLYLRKGLTNTPNGIFKSGFNLSHFFLMRPFSTAGISQDVNVNEEQTGQPKFEFNVDKKKIFNKKTHYRYLEIDNKLNPAKTIQEQDERELTDWHKKKIFDKRFVRINEDWQKNLMKSKKRKALTKFNFENYPILGEQPEKFVVHNPEKVISIPPPDNKLFAVIKFKGHQHKVTKDDRIKLEKVEGLEVGDSFFFDNVLLVASDEYTSVGRPSVKTAKVLACVEEHSLTEKVIIFKKKRRKGYQRNSGHRQSITVVKILKIIHEPNEDSLENYHPLIKV